MYWGVKLRRLFRAVPKVKELMLDEPVKIVKNDFKLKKRVPLSAKPKAGFRFGVEIEGIGSEDIPNEWTFLNKWCEANKQLENTYKTQMRELG